MFKFNPIYVGVLCSIISMQSIADPVKTPNGFIVSKDVKHDISLPLRYLQAKDKLNAYHYSSWKNTLQNLTPNPATSFVPLKGFQGLGVGLGDYEVRFSRPDIAGSVGMTQYVEIVNADIGVFDKTTGSLAPGFPKPTNTLWAGFGGPCEFTNKGNSTVKYDQLAHRWVLSQSAYENGGTNIFYQCIAVSTSEDATGSYFRYAFQFNGFNENTRLSLWPDAYYVGTILKGPINFGPQACAMDRVKMIAGLPATMQCKSFTVQQASQMIPADLAGIQLPPAGSDGYFINLDPPNNILIYRFHVDFTNPTNSVITNFHIAVTPYKEACQDRIGMDCAIQPNTTNRLDVHSYRPMGRIPYRQFRDYGSIVFTHTIEGPAPKFAPAIRWYELRIPTNNPNINPIIYQQATLAPDSKNRFLAGIGIDRFTNIAMGYNVTSSLIYPSLELAKHNFNDAHNTMTIQPLVTGMGSQVNGVTDWGGNSRMSVDPIDECTFWYAGQYLKTTGSNNWSTFILKFKLAACA